MIKYKFNTKANILETDFLDLVSFHDIKNYMQSIHDNETFPRKLNVIIDAQDVEFEVVPTDSQEVASFNFSLSKNFEHIKTAIVTNDPNPTSLAQLYQYGANSKNYEVKLFTLKENAQRWLKQN